MNEQPKLDIDAAIPAVVCEHCKEPFEPRAKSGGSRQRFCSSECRIAFNNSNRVPSVSEENPSVSASVSPERPSVSDALDTFEKPEPPKPTVKPAPVHDDTSEFSWNEDHLVVVPHQAAIAVYENPHGDIVIRQEGHYGPDEDHWIVVSRENLVLLILRLQKISGDF